jgi:hypothetical protein
MKEEKISREELDFGPIHIERIGRVIRIKSNWKEYEHQKFMNDVKNKRPELKKEIDNKIDELLQAVKTYDPFELLAPISVVNLTSDPEAYTEITHTGNESIVEYLFSIIASLPFPTSSKKPTAETIQKIIDLLKEIQNKIIWYYSSEITEGKLDEKEAEIRFRLMNYSLMVRGHSYPQHVEKTFLELFSQHDKFLIEKFGFSSKQFLEFVKKVCDQIEGNINRTRDQGLKPFHQAFNNFQSYTKDNQKINPQKLIESFKKENKPLIEECQKNIGYLNDLGGPKVFQIIVNNEIDKKIIESISIKLGENKDFLELKDNRGQPLKGWFLNPSLIYEKPIIFHENTFFCFHPQVLFRNILFILEKLIKRNDKKYLKKIYESRDNYLENKGIEIISNILKIEGSKVYRNLHYNGVELDGLIEYDDILILIEAKAGKLSESAKRGSTKSFIDDMKNDLLGKAYEQGNRVLEYIKKTEEANFFDENENEILKIKKENYNYFFVISLYFEPIGHIITNLSLMKELGVVSNEKHWAVYLNDLRVISEIADCPSLFIHYLTRRLEVNRFSQFNSFDELDTFMLYLREGLYFEEFPEDLTKIQFIGYTEDLDKYYLYLEGKRSKVEKPSQKMPEFFKKFIEKLEFKRPMHFTTASIELLNCDDKTRKKISEQTERCESDYEKDKKTHSVSLIFEKPGLALLLSTLPFMELEKHSEMWSRKYLQDNMIKRVAIIYWAPKIENTEKEIHVYVRGYNHE